jgi:hypothetical protein
VTRDSTRQKCGEELVVLIRDDGLLYPKVYPHSFEEELDNIFLCDIIFVGYEDVHLRKPINDHKYMVISLPSRWKARHVNH